MTTQRWLAIFLAMTGLMTARAVDRYVSLYGTNDAGGGYTNWSGAATSVHDAVTAAGSSETIWMSNGVFCLTDRLVMSSSKTLRSVNGRDLTIINGLADGWGTAATTGKHVYLVGATFDGITVSNGYGITNATEGLNKSSGGIDCDAGTIINSKITHCTVGGAYFSNGGGGVNMYDGLMSNCIIQYCYSVNAGGGVGLTCQPYAGCSPVMRNCTIQNNRNGWVGGGLAVVSAGGGLALAENCMIINNTNANGGGGGIYMGNGGLVRNCLVVSNYTDGIYGGGGIVMGSVKTYSSTDGVFNCTMAANASTLGGGINIADANNANTIINCIIYSNYADLAHSTPNDVVLADPVSSNAFWYSCLTNSIPSDRHCITGKPLLVDCAGGNYRLSANAPCINAGTNQEWMPNAVDLDAQMRIRYGTVDMGAYEHIHSGTIFTFH